MSNTFTPRYYQVEAEQALYKYFKENSGNPVIVLPTGTGKSYCIASFVKNAILSYPETRIIMCTHSRELISQNFAELMSYWPEAPAGILSAGLNKKSYHHQIIFAGIQTAYKDAFKLGWCDILLVDECDSIPHEEEGIWRKFIADFMITNPSMKVVGYTATDWRTNGGSITKGDTRIFTDVAYKYSILQAIKDGYLCEVVSKPTTTHLTVEGVHKRGGEFVPGELEKAVDIPAKTNAAVYEMVTLGTDRKAWIAFCSGIKHSEHVRDALREYGVTAEMITSKTPTGERDQIIRDYKAGKIRCLVGMNIFTVGFNHPPIDLIACLRPTGSSRLFVQMVGRGVRLSPGKDSCVLLDFAGCLLRHGPIDQIKGKDPSGKGDGEAPQKVCLNCHAYCHASAMICADCGNPFPPRDLEKKLTRTASDAPILSTQTPSNWVQVSGWKLEQHYKPGSPLSVRVEYQCGPQTHKEWIALGHTGYPRDKAVRWWYAHKGQTPPPTNAEEAILRQHELVCPTQVLIKKAGKYTEIVDRKL